MIHCAQKYPPGGSPDPAEVQYLHGDLPAHHPDEHHQPGHRLPPWGEQAQWSTGELRNPHRNTISMIGGQKLSLYY